MQQMIFLHGPSESKSEQDLEIACGRREGRGRERCTMSLPRKERRGLRIEILALAVWRSIIRKIRTSYRLRGSLFSADSLSEGATEMTGKKSRRRLSSERATHDLRVTPFKAVSWFVLFSFDKLMEMLSIEVQHSRPTALPGG